MAAHVSRPDYAYVGNHTYTINWFTQQEWEAGHLDPDSDACTFASLKQIYIRLLDQVVESHYQELVLHELMHAVWDSTMLTHTKLTEPEDPEEFIIGISTPALLFTLRMTPDLNKYLMSDGSVVR